MSERILAILLVVSITAAVFLISWGISVGIWYLVCLCFTWEFSLLHATGIWLLLMLISSAFPKSTGRK